MDERSRKLELVKKEDNEKAAASGVLPQVVPRNEILTSNIGPGAVIDGKYLVGKVIGEGAFGIVYEARNLELDEKVALKTMRPETAADKELVARFAREAKAAASIKSEYVASVYDVGTTKAGAPFIIMEYLEGKNLETVLAENGPLPVRTAIEYALQICEALAVAHSRGTVHRDIKPENLLLTERAGGMRIVKVLDFGISKAALTGSIFGSDIPIVKTVNLVGTPLYMPPEAVRATGGADVRSDIWSLGMVLHEILTGVPAFKGSSIPEICAAILEQQPTPMTDFRSDLPPGLVDVVMKCLAKDRKDRHQNVAELAINLLPYGPKRSRLNVERAVAILKAAGQVSADLEVVSTYPPSSLDATSLEQSLRDSLLNQRRSSNPDLGGFSPNEAPTAPALYKRREIAERGDLTPPPTATVGARREAPRRRRGVAVAALGAVGAVVVATIAAVALRSGPTETTSSPSAPSTSELAGQAATAGQAPEPASGAATAEPEVKASPPPSAAAETPPTTDETVAQDNVAPPRATAAPPAAAWRPRAPAMQPAANARPATKATATATASPPASPAATPTTTAAPAATATGRTFRRDL